MKDINFNLRDAELYVEVLTGDKDSPMTFQTLPGPHGGSQLTKTLQGSLTQHWDQLCELACSGANVFTTINETDGKGRKKENITKLRACVIDDDGKNPKPLIYSGKGIEPFTSLPPAMSVETSPQRYHHYFPLIEDQSLDLFTPTQKALANYYNTDRAIVDLPRLIRVPAFYNHKAPESPFLVRTVHAEKIRYSIEQIRAAHPGVVEPRSLLKKSVTNNISKGQKFDNRELTNERMRKAGRYVAKVPPAIEGSYGDSFTFKLCATLTRGFELADDEALAVLAEWNELCVPPWPEAKLLDKLQNGRNYGQEPIGGRLQKPNFAMLCEFFRNEPDLAVACGQNGKIEMDERTGEIYLDRQRFGSETDISRIRENLSRYIVQGFDFKKDLIFDALTLVASEQKYNPVKDYLNGLIWDGVPRIETIQKIILCSPNSQPIADILIRKWFISAVARALDPGCKVDTVLILVGPQGARKSSFFKMLAGEWFTDSPIDIENKDALLIMGEKWLVEWPELQSMLRARSQNSVKAFLTAQSDTFRPPYARKTISQKRSSIIVGTTNDRDFLIDPTGNRRHWPVEVGTRINIELLSSIRDQLWAEAVAAYKASEIWHLLSDEEDELQNEQLRYEREDCWLEAVASYVEAKETVLTAEILRNVFEIPTRDFKRGHQMRVSECLRKLGFYQKQLGKDRVRTWLRTNSPRGL